MNGPIKWSFSERLIIFTIKYVWLMNEQWIFFPLLFTHILPSLINHERNKQSLVFFRDSLPKINKVRHKRKSPSHEMSELIKHQMITQFFSFFTLVLIHSVFIFMRCPYMECSYLLTECETKEIYCLDLLRITTMWGVRRQVRGIDFFGDMIVTDILMIVD